MSQLALDTTVNCTRYVTHTRDEAEVNRVASWHRTVGAITGLVCFSRGLCGLPFTVSISSEFYRGHKLRRRKNAERKNDKRRLAALDKLSQPIIVDRTAAGIAKKCISIAFHTQN